MSRKPPPPHADRCEATGRNGKRCRNRHRVGQFCGKHTPKGDPPPDGDDSDLDPDVLERGAAGRIDVRSWAKSFPIDGMAGAKEVFVAIIARNYVTGNDRRACAAGKVLASIMMAEAEKAKSERPIAVYLGDPKGAAL